MMPIDPTTKQLPLLRSRYCLNRTLRPICCVLFKVGFVPLRYIEQQVLRSQFTLNQHLLCVTRHNSSAIQNIANIMRASIYSNERTRNIIGERFTMTHPIVNHSFRPCIMHPWSRRMSTPLDLQCSSTSCFFRRRYLKSLRSMTLSPPLSGMLL